MTLSIECLGDCRFADCRDYLIILLSVLTLIVVMLNVIVLYVVAPSKLMCATKPLVKDEYGLSENASYKDLKLDTKMQVYLRK
jgi:hypothetical protein